MPEHVKVICITCPKGCTLDVTREGTTILKVEGGGCKRGSEYVTAEINDPRRMVATTVRVEGSLHPLLPVYTAKPFPKPRIKELLTQIRTIHLTAPVKMGQVVLADALGTGVDVIASRDMVKREV
jgi:CxxC motif-containing protein